MTPAAPVRPWMACCPVCGKAPRLLKMPCLMDREKASLWTAICKAEVPVHHDLIVRSAYSERAVNAWNKAMRKAV